MRPNPQPYAGMMLLLVTACTLRTSPGGADDELEFRGHAPVAAQSGLQQIGADRAPGPQEPFASTSTIGLTFSSLREAFDRYEAQGFLLHGSFENGEWPATVVYEKEASNQIRFVLKNGQPHGYPGNDGYRMKAVALEDRSGGETMLVFRSKEKACAPGAGSPKPILAQRSQSSRDRSRTPGCASSLRWMPLQQP